MIMSTNRLLLSLLNIPDVKTFQGWLDTPPDVKQDSGGAQIRILEPKSPGPKSGIAQTDGNSSERCKLCSLPERVGADSPSNNLNRRCNLLQNSNSTGTVI